MENAHRELYTQHIFVSTSCTYSGNRISYVRDELGHYKGEYEVYYCPECVSENWFRISTTFEGHVWTYEDQEHIHGMDMHVVYYKCYPCGKEHQVWHDYQWPCAIRYYGLRPAVVPY